MNFFIQVSSLRLSLACGSLGDHAKDSSSNRHGRTTQRTPTISVVFF
jgi:hypothetical protein